MRILQMHIYNYRILIVINECLRVTSPKPYRMTTYCWNSLAPVFHHQRYIKLAVLFPCKHLTLAVSDLLIIEQTVVFKCKLLS